MRTVVCHTARPHPAHEWTCDHRPVTCPGVTVRLTAPPPALPRPGDLTVSPSGTPHIVLSVDPGNPPLVNMLALSTRQCGDDAVHQPHAWTHVWLSTQSPNVYCPGLERQLSRSSLLAWLDREAVTVRKGGPGRRATLADLAERLRSGEFDAQP